MRKVVYIDYENLPGVHIEDVEGTKFLIFIGENQKKIPTDTIVRMQPLGERVEWISISGVGRNALDFHIAYYLAKYHTNNTVTHYILSKEGYDPLIKHVVKFGQRVKRIITLEEIKEKPVRPGARAEVRQSAGNPEETGQDAPSEDTQDAGVEHRNALQGQVCKEDTDLLIEHLFRERFIEEKNKRIAYLTESFFQSAK